MRRFVALMLMDLFDFLFLGSSGCERTSCLTLSQDLFECNGVRSERDTFVDFGNGFFQSSCNSRYEPGSQPTPPKLFFISKYLNSSKQCDVTSNLSSSVTTVYEIPRAVTACVPDMYGYFYNVSVAYKGDTRNQARYTGFAHCEVRAILPRDGNCTSDTTIRVHCVLFLQ